MSFDAYKHEVLKYSPLTRLNTVEIWHDQADSKSQEAFWIVYIHGGAWRDPSIDSSSVHGTLSHLGPVSSNIKGVASLNHRLSEHPNHSTNPSGVDDTARNAVHPHHIEDVMTGLCWLQHRYQFKDRYILVGHSAGATLAFQTVTGYWEPFQSDTKYPLSRFIPPIAIAGVAGIYDIQALIKSFSSIPAYREFVEAAFGLDELVWKKASPANAELHSTWTNGKLAIIAYSEEDEMIDQVQSDRMWHQLQKERTESRQDIQLQLHGDHDDIWRGGSEMAKVIIYCIQNLVDHSRNQRSE